MWLLIVSIGHAIDEMLVEQYITVMNELQGIRRACGRHVGKIVAECFPKERFYKLQIQRMNLKWILINRNTKDETAGLTSGPGVRIFINSSSNATTKAGFSSASSERILLSSQILGLGDWMLSPNINFIVMR